VFRNWRKERIIKNKKSKRRSRSPYTSRMATEPRLNTSVLLCMSLFIVTMMYMYNSFSSTFIARSPNEIAVTRELLDLGIELHAEGLTLPFDASSVVVKLKSAASLKDLNTVSEVGNKEIEESMAIVKQPTYRPTEATSPPSNKPTSKLKRMELPRDPFTIADMTSIGIGPNIVMAYQIKNPVKVWPSILPTLENGNLPLTGFIRELIADEIVVGVKRIVLKNGDSWLQVGAHEFIPITLQQINTFAIQIKKLKILKFFNVRPFEPMDDCTLSKYSATRNKMECFVSNTLREESRRLLASFEMHKIKYNNLNPSFGFITADKIQKDAESNNVEPPALKASIVKDQKYVPLSPSQQELVDNIDAAFEVANDP